VRIDLENYDPDKSPLFVGTSVVPYVLFKEPPTGSDAGKFLQTSAPQTQTGGSTANSPDANK
jgi:membrane fusion protein, multidrug efflux system